MITHFAFDVLNVLLVQEQGSWVPNMPLASLCSRLTFHYHLGIISNTSDNLVAHYPVFDPIFFDPVIISGQVGLAKPDPAIFQLFCTRASCHPSEVLFIDDTLSHVAAAQAFGMTTHHYTNFTNLTAYLNNYFSIGD